MIEDGIKISELNTTSSVNNEDLIPIVQEEETKSITYEDLFSSNNVKGTVYSHYLTPRTNLVTNTWAKCADGYSITNLPQGTYMFIFDASFGCASGVTGSTLCTIRPFINDVQHNAYRDTMPIIASYTSSGQVIYVGDAQGTFTINVEVYCPLSLNCNVCNVKLIRLK